MLVPHGLKMFGWSVAPIVSLTSLSVATELSGVPGAFRLFAAKKLSLSGDSVPARALPARSKRSSTHRPAVRASWRDREDRRLSTGGQLGGPVVVVVTSGGGELEPEGLVAVEDEVWAWPAVPALVTRFAGAGARCTGAKWGIASW